ncbi:hypothetical protein CRYUN_Cryun09bG0134400 [Craigia yunnanensis]
MGVIKASIGDALLTSMWCFGVYLHLDRKRFRWCQLQSHSFSHFLRRRSQKDSSLLSMAVRFPAQAAGGVAGVKAILGLIPRQYSKTLKGPSLKVDLHTGAIAEGLLTFGLSLALLVILFKGPKNPLLKLWLMALSTVGLVSTGSKYTGPSMNPANAFGWAYVNNWHNSWELYYVYWIGPLIGATLAAWVFRFLLSPPPTKEKKA